MSFLTNNAIKYTLKHLFKVAGIPNINQDLIEISLDNRNVKIHIESKLIIFNISTKEEINGLLEGTLKISSISWVGTILQLCFISLIFGM